MNERGLVPVGSTARRSRREFRRTPVHQQVLTRVLEGQIAWRTTVGLSGGFVPVGGPPFGPSEELVALYELRNAGLIDVDAGLGRVTITADGLARLSQWVSWQHGKAS